MKNANTTKQTSPESGWRRFDAMTDEERRAAALRDPDAQPITPENMGKMSRTPQVKVIRRALGLTREEFSSRFHIPLAALRDWEQNVSEPDAAVRAYLTVIARNPQAVADALDSAPA
ncbi:MAG: helix-turn-helix domain-containing protein [Syntrophobacteraceae bacterium]